MDLKRLFQVLVVGGSVAAGCERSRPGALAVADAAGAQEVGIRESGAPEVPVAAEDAAADSATSEDAAGFEVASADVGGTADAATSTDAADGPMGSPCFCSPTKCCDLHDGAPATVQPGLFCCWSTKC